MEWQAICRSQVSVFREVYESTLNLASGIAETGIGQIFFFAVPPLIDSIYEFCLSRH